VPPAEHERYRQREAASLAMVAWLDAEIGWLLEELHRRRLDGDTLVVFLIDNGWAIGLPSKGSAFEKGLRTPLLFRWPGHIPRGRVLGALGSTLDVMPTILDYAGVPIPPGCAGRSLRPLLEGLPADTRDALFGALYPRVATGTASQDVYALYARTKRWKYVLYLREPRPDAHFGIHHVLAPFPARAAGDEDLFDLRRDPYELHDLADDAAQAERLAVLRRRVLAWWRETGGGTLPLPDPPQ
jgi:arylsulfatase A-like enzyme